MAMVSRSGSKLSALCISSVSTRSWSPSSIIMNFIKYVLRIPLRMSEEVLLIGDDAIHGEEAYALFFESQRSHYPEDSGNSPSSDYNVELSISEMGMGQSMEHHKNTASPHDVEVGLPAHHGQNFGLRDSEDKVYAGKAE